MATNPSWCLTGLSPESKRRDFKRLHTQKSNISRLENVNSKISPKLSTIEEYAKAVGFKLDITMG
jgi:transcriptional regulator with XRE-family HTH domain